MSAAASNVFTGMWHRDEPAETARDRGLLTSAAGRPRSRAFGADAYPRFAEKAAASMHSLACNHALVAEDSRLAWAATRVFCLLNRHDLAFSVDEAEAAVIAVATGELDGPDLTKVIECHLGTALA